VLAPLFLGADAVQNQTSFLRDIPSGKYAGIVVRLSGDAQAGQTFIGADLGRIRLIEGGRDLVAADADNLRFINMNEGGSSRIQNTAGGASAMTVLLPRFWGGVSHNDGNVHQIIESDIVQVQIQFGAGFTTRFQAGDTAQVKLYGLVRELGEMTYNLLLHQIDQNLGAGTFTLPVRNENVLGIYFVTNANLERVRVVKDGEEMANVQQGGALPQNSDLVDISDLLSTTDAPDQVAVFTAAAGATAPSSVAKVVVAEPGEVGEYLSDDIVVEYTLVGNQVQECIIASADFTPTKLRQTKVEAGASIARKTSRKNTLARGRPVQAIRISGE
jgi:hypothetical protein